MPDDEDQQEPGIRGTGRDLIRSLVEWLQARYDLAAFEGREGVQRYRGIALSAGVGFALLIVAYTLLIIALLAMLPDEAPPAAWHSATLVVGGIHFVVGVLLCLHARRAARRYRLFGSTLDEIRKDREWLGNQRQ